MSERGMRFRLGMFVLLASVLFGSLIVLFGTVPSFLKRQKVITVRFPDASGVGPGTPVRRSGVRIGEVQRLALDDESGEVFITLGIDRQFTVRRSDQPTLTQSLLGGDTTVDFIPPPPDAAPPPDRTPVEGGEWPSRGVRQIGVTNLLAQAAEVVPTTQETLNEIRKTLQRFERLTPDTERALREYTALARDLRESIPELRRTNTEIQELARSTRQQIPEVRRTVEEVQALARIYTRIGERLNLLLANNEDRITRIIENASDVLARAVNLLSDENQRNVNATLKSLRATTENAESITRNVDQMVKEAKPAVKPATDAITKLDAVLGDAQKLTRPLAARSDVLVKNIDESTEKLNRLLTDAGELLRLALREEGTLRRFLTDPGLYRDLDDLLLMVAHLMPRLDRILRDVEVFADKIARHPELIGAGGLVNPSKGLKEGPSGWSRPPGH